MSKALAIPSLAAALALGAPAAAQDAANGEAVYYDHACYSCHGYNGAGRTPLDTSISGILGDEELFITFLRMRAEQNPILPSTSMPNYPEESLSDTDARDLYAYILDFQHETPALEDIPLFQELLEAAEN